MTHIPSEIVRSKFLTYVISDYLGLRLSTIYTHMF
jgi:hypothetical protein